MEKSKVCLLITTPFNPQATTAAAHQTTSINSRIVTFRDNCQDPSQIPRSQALLRSRLPFCHHPPMERRSQSSRFHRSNNLLRKEIVDQACNPLLDLHQNNKTLWLRYNEVGIWKDEHLGDIPRIRYRNILALPLMACPCCPQLRSLPYPIEAEMSESQ